MCYNTAACLLIPRDIIIVGVGNTHTPPSCQTVFLIMIERFLNVSHLHDDLQILVGTVRERDFVSGKLLT